MANGTFTYAWRLLNGRVKLLTFSCFLGFGLTACSGGDDANEPVENEVAAASGDEAAAPPADQQATTDEAAPATEPSLTADDGSAPVDEATPTDTADATLDSPAAPPEVMAANDSNGELTSEGDQTPMPTADAAPADTPSPDLTAETPTDTAAQPAGDAASVATADPGEPTTIASPGAAMYIKGKHDSGHAHHSKTHKQVAGAKGAHHTTAGSNEEIYVVRPGDTVAQIAKTIYGNVKAWHSMADLNGMKAPFRIFPGDELKFDMSDAKAAEFAKSYHAGMKTVVVQKGDTLSKLAEQVYGSRTAWKLFLSYNKTQISNPNRISVGMKLAYADRADAQQPAQAQHKAAKALRHTAGPKVKKNAPITVKDVGE